MGGKSGGTTTTTSESGPPEWVIPFYTGLWNEAGEWYNSGQGSDYFPDSTVVPPAPQTQQAIDMMEGRANQGMPLTNQLWDFSSTMLDPNVFNNNVGRFGDNNYVDPAVRDYLQTSVDGGYMTDRNPHAQEYWNQLRDDTVDEANALFNQNGRFGSINNQDHLANRLTEEYHQLMYPIYESERGRQQQAAGMLSDLDFQNVNTRMALDQQDINNAMNTVGQLPGLYNYSNMDIDQLGQVGNFYEQQGAQQLQDSINRWEFQRQEPINALQQFMGIINGIPVGNTSTTTQPAPYTNPLVQGAGLFNLLGGSTTTQQGGGKSGGLLPLLSSAATVGSKFLSDRRLKENIDHLYTDERGIKWYSFDYKEGPKGQIGVMSDEVPQEFVTQVNGYDTVDYGALKGWRPEYA